MTRLLGLVYCDSVAPMAITRALGEGALKVLASVLILGQDGWEAFSLDAYEQVFCSAAKGNLVAEIKWRMVKGDRRTISGKVSAPAVADSQIQSMVEFEFSWGESADSFFDNLDELLAFLWTLSDHLKPVSLVVEAKKAPREVTLLRADRFERSDSRSLCYLDWITGASHRLQIAERLRALRDQVFRFHDGEELVMLVTSEQPLDLKREADRDLLNRLEFLAGLDSETDGDPS